MLSATGNSAVIAKAEPFTTSVAARAKGTDRGVMDGAKADEDTADDVIGQGLILAFDLLAIHEGFESVFIEGALLGVRHILLGDEHQFGAIVLIGEINRFLALFRVGHAGDDAIDAPGLEIGDKRLSNGLDDLDFLAGFLSEKLRDLNVVAIGIAPGVIGDRKGVVIGGALRPIEGGVIAFESHLQRIVITRISGTTCQHDAQ